MEKRKKLGEIFIDNGLLTDKTVERMLALSKKLGKRFGTVLEDLELVSGEELAHALASQYGCRVASNFAGYSFSAQLLRTIPVDVAMQNHIFPLKLDEKRLALAMADPTDTRVVRNISANLGLTITPFIATRKEIYAAICKNYLQKEVCSAAAHTVLVVEDDKLIGTMFADFLGREGFRVIQAADGLEAYKAVLTEKPHVVLTDLMMPKLDGFGLFDALRSVPDLSSIPVILITSSLQPEDEVKAFEKGFFDFIEKPVREETLITRVKRALQFRERTYQLS
ncbi:response regulator [Geomonas subterranea]|uniref:Response regulator n=1 Tax=Geomonas subterranea TaxID=2847989 RepID=A0ABX8LIU8_9BACT|nr:response regulator [Geomonas subterranea]QXE91867.1 response regulator [Geomonas subterranea]QXM10041.1 response regulator [Geomonas subterranea]